VQAHDEPRKPREELARVLESGLNAKSTGVMMFTIGGMAADDKMAAVETRVQEPWQRRRLSRLLRRALIRTSPAS